jgi:GTP-binding protein HflX
MPYFGFPKKYMFEVRERPEMVERAMLVSIYFDPKEEDQAESLLEELHELVKTLEINIVHSVLVRSRSLHKQFLCGTGKAQEIIDLARAFECDVIVFDNGLAPSQQREWEKLGNIAVIDREEVILDIFNKRAATREARIQVDLARMQYALPRMARMWGHLDREGGGGSSGGGAANRGMGEKQIEVDRRLAHTRIDRLKRELEDVRAQRRTQRKERQKLGTPHAAIVGYTNSGKSTLLNRLSGADVLAKDMLFATLDTTTRRIELPDGQPLLLTDTVGFVRNLPHRLVEAFKATLEEAVLADFLIHVLDCSSPEVDELYNTTLEVLEELGAGEKKIITVLNKSDLLEDQVQRLLLENRYHGAIFISAASGMNLDSLLAACSEVLADRVHIAHYRIPQTRGDILHLLHREAKISETQYEENDVIITAIVPTHIAGKLQPFLIAPE